MYPSRRIVNAYVLVNGNMHVLATYVIICVYFLFFCASTDGHRPIFHMHVYPPMLVHVSAPRFSMHTQPCMWICTCGVQVLRVCVRMHLCICERESVCVCVRVPVPTRHLVYASQRDALCLPLATYQVECTATMHFGCLSTPYISKYLIDNVKAEGHMTTT